MTLLLEKAFEKATSLPPELQDEFGALFIAEMESELRWNELFEQSQDVLAQMGQEALEEYRAGKTKALGWDEL
jgi:hypothetical protein